MDERMVSTSDLEPLHLTDLGNTSRFIVDHGSEIRYVPAWRKWLVWDGRRWCKDERLAILGRAHQTVLGIYAEATAADSDQQRRDLARHALNSESASRIRAMVDLARSEPAVVVTPDQLDADPWKLTVLNGTLDLGTGELQPHRAEDLITKLAPVTYDPSAECARWLAFLERIFDGNKNVIGFVQRAIGSALTGIARDQAFFIFWGSGANGKTTLITVIMNLLGDYALPMPTSTLMAKRSTTIPNDVARLKGARFVTAVEGDEGQRLAEGLIKPSRAEIVSRRDSCGRNGSTSSPSANFSSRRTTGRLSVARMRGSGGASGSCRSPSEFPTTSKTHS